MTDPEAELTAYQRIGATFLVERGAALMLQNVLPIWGSVALSILSLPAALLWPERALTMIMVFNGAAVGWHLAFCWLVLLSLLRHRRAEQRYRACMAAQRARFLAALKEIE